MGRVGSYVVKADDIRNLVEQIEGLKPAAATLDYKKDLLDRLMEPEFRRIKWFFYCDDKTATRYVYSTAAFFSSMAGFSERSISCYAARSWEAEGKI